MAKLSEVKGEMVSHRLMALVNKTHAASTKLVKACKAVAQAIQKEDWPDKEKEEVVAVWEKAAKKVADIVGSDA